MKIEKVFFLPPDPDKVFFFCFTPMKYSKVPAEKKRRHSKLRVFYFVLFLLPTYRNALLPISIKITQVQLKLRNDLEENSSIQVQSFNKVL